LNESDRLITELGLTADDERYVLSLRDDSKRRLACLVQSRMFIGYYPKERELSIQLRPDALERLAHTGITWSFTFKGSPEGNNYKLPIGKYREYREVLFPETVALARELLPRGKRAPQRKHHITDLDRMVREPDFRGKALDHLLDQKGPWPGQQAPSYWLFQGNPQRYDAIGALRDGQLRYWSATKHQEAICPGDKVILWQSGKQAGCYALCTVTTPVHQVHASTSPYDRVPQEEGSRPVVELRVDQNLWDTPILQESIADNPAAAALKAGLQGTNFSATREQYELFLELAGKVAPQSTSGYESLIAKLPAEAVELYLSMVHTLLVQLGVKATDPRVVFSTPDDGRLTLIVGRRYAIWLGPEKDAIACGILSGERSLSGAVASGSFSGPPTAFWQEFRQLEQIQDHWTILATAVRRELARTNKSNFLRHNDRVFMQAVLDAPILDTLMTKDVLPAQQHPLNTILYGPPGTGKTYHTVSYAVAIIEDKPLDAVMQEDRFALRERFEQYLEAKLVRMVTFHQSFSYEDFVEGIKPQTIQREESEEKMVTYEVVDGVFKNICRSARGQEKGAERARTAAVHVEEAAFWKMSLGIHTKPEDEEIYQYCLEHDVVAVGYGGRVDVTGAADEDEVARRLATAGVQENDERSYVSYVLRSMALDMQDGDIILIAAGNSTIRAIAQVTGAYFVDETAPIRFKQFRRVRWLATDLDLPVDDVYGTSFKQGTIYRLKDDQVNREYFHEEDTAQDEGPRPHVLIIDEINRGNVAGIFGELITLLEDDKREGGPEETRVKLPYSKEEFSVPRNVHLIGTMNTADRSVEALDTALRRRFSFREMPARPDLLNGQQLGGVDLQRLLSTINERVEQLLDKDHHIGHSYFMSISSGVDLKRVFANKVLPLLDEYFHGDARKVGAVLGKAFVELKESTTPLATGFDLDEYETRTLYVVKDPMRFADLSPFRTVYEEW
ncbi:MAG: EVE domain-containing protein, partial [Flavobacteriales bacterium]|nr:EVE domain-containing protein [Flavobacteriales bacterium]